MPITRCPAASKRASPSVSLREDDVGGDRGGEERVLDRDQAEGEGRGEAEGDRDPRLGAVEERPRAGGERQSEQGADRAQDEAAVGLVAFGTEDEEDRQRDPVAVLPHPGDAVDRDAEPERDAVADRVAADRRGERPVVAQARLGPRPVPAALVVGVAVVDEPDATRPGRLDQAAGGAVEEGRERVVGGQEEALGDHQRDRGGEADEGEPQGVGEAVARRRGDQAHRQHRRRGELAAQHAERRRDPDQRRRPRLPERPRPGGRVHRGESADEGGGRDRPARGPAEGELEDQRDRDRHRDEGAAAQRGPRRGGPDREERRGAQALNLAGGVVERAV